MSTSKRKPFIAGNWKMNLERRTALDLVAAIRERVGHRQDVDVAVFPTFVYLADVVKALAGSPVKVGAQNCCAEGPGAFTGEVCATQIVDVGATHVILGHSERRHVYGETDDLIARKVKTALAAGLDVILCVGETLAERDAKKTEHVIGAQLKAGLSGVDQRAMQKITIAYEPVWAIGTGRNATSQQASESHAYLRGVLAGLYSDRVADATRIQYGGSVKPSNVQELMAAHDVDGCLVGGASLTPESFLPLLEFR